MQIKYYDDNGHIRNINITVNQKFNKIIADKPLGQLFSALDNGDNVIQESELTLLQKLLKLTDKDKNNIYSSEEIMDAKNLYNDSLKQMIYKDLHPNNKNNGIGFGNIVDVAKLKKDLNYIIKTGNMQLIFYDETSKLFEEIWKNPSMQQKDKSEVTKIILNSMKNSLPEHITKAFEKELKDLRIFDKGKQFEALRLRAQKWYNGNFIGGKKSKINGKIDEAFNQGEMGTCWLLSTIKSLIQIPQGKKILNNSLKVDNINKTITVHLQGVNKSYTYKFSDIENAKEFSSGDADVCAIEMAVEQYLHESRGLSAFDSQGDGSSHGGTLFDAISILVNDKNLDYSDGEVDADDPSMSEIYKAGSDAYFAENMVFQTQLRDDIQGNYLRLKGKNGETIVISNNHAYSISRFNSQYAYIVDPMQGNEIAIKINDFKNNFVLFHAKLK